MPLSIPADTSAASAREQLKLTSRRVQAETTEDSSSPAANQSADLAEFSRSGTSLLAPATPGTAHPAEAARLASLVAGSMGEDPSGASATQANASPQAVFALLR